MNKFHSLKSLVFLLVLQTSVYAIGDIEPENIHMNIPSKKLAVNEYPQFHDDMDFNLMEKAIERQTKAFKRWPLRGTITLDSQNFPLDIVKRSLFRFHALLKETAPCFDSGDKALCWSEFNKKIRERFDLYRPVSKNSSKAHFTGYYSPTFQGKKIRGGSHKYGIYKKPKTEDLRRSTRNQINFEDRLENKGLELFYIEDPFEQYLLHVEGGGLVQTIENNSTKNWFVSYDGSNSQSFRFISKYMKDKGYITDTSIASQKKFLKNNPDKWEEIYAQCPSFIYFKITNDEPLGLENIPLTSGRSIAQDKKLYKRKGLLTFIHSDIPYRDRNGQVRKKEMKRFFIDQDTGGAIKGEARADLYFGFGEQAEFLANYVNEKGLLYFLIAK